MFSYGKKQLFLSICLCVSCLLITGCSRTELQKKNETLYSVSNPKELVIYTPHYTDKTAFIIREFRERTGLSVRLVSEGTGELLSRLTEEQAAGQWNADVFWGGGIESLEANKSLFQPYNSPNLTHIPQTFYSPEGYWTGFSVMTMVIIYNTVLVQSDKVPENWDDLLDPFFTGRIIMADPPKSGSAFSIINTILSAGKKEEFLWAFLGELKKNVGPGGLSLSSSTVHTAVASGEYFAGLVSEDAALSIINTGAKIAIVYPSDGTVKIPDGVALVKNASHKSEAEQFIDFVLDEDVQKIVAGRWFRRSVRTDIPLPTGAEKYTDITFLPYDIYSAAEKRTAILKRWENLGKPEAN